MNEGNARNSLSTGVRVECARHPSDDGESQTGDDRLVPLY